MRVVQLLPTLSYGDAVGNDALALKKLLQQLEFQTQIYAENIDPRLPRGTAEPFTQFPELSDDDVILYHASTGTELNDRLPSLKGRKWMIYHNITPPEFFRPYAPAAEALTASGLKGVRKLADHIEHCIADSEFNKRDLLRMGYTCPIDICPVLIPFSDYEKEPNRRVLRRYQGDGRTNLLFVGRIAPNKKQENVIRAFYFYHKYYNPDSRLFLVGSWNGMECYYERLCDYVEALGITEHVIFTGHIHFDEILAYYHLADVFLCMSEHEGFCVPLVEAMYFQVPIVAYSCAAVPDTLGGSGVLLNSNDPMPAAAAIHEIVTSASLRQEILETQAERLCVFEYESVRNRLEKTLLDFLKRTDEKKPRIIQLSSTISCGDAVGNDILAFQEAFISMGYPSVVYTEFPPRGAGLEMVQSEEQIPVMKLEDIAIYHHATGTDLAKRFSGLPCRKIMVYHNVTPPRFFAPYDKAAAESCKRGLENVREMQGAVDGCIADSEFNRRELQKMGYTCPINICPILLPFRDYSQQPDPETMHRYSDGHTNIIFVGRVAPNKKFEDIISVFEVYQRLFDSEARLILVGSYDEQGAYFQSLCQLVEKLALKNVVFTGHIPFSNILAYYRIADAFLCMSEHEGFCVPLIESMYFDVPIVAYASTAIPETLGGSGVLLESKEPAAVADVVHRMVWDQEARNQVLEGQRARLKAFSYDQTKGVLAKIIRSYAGGRDEE